MVNALAPRGDEGREGCDKPRGAAVKRRSVDFRMGQPTGRKGPVSLAEYIGQGSERGELKHLSTHRRRKKTLDSPSSGERNGKSLNRIRVIAQGVAYAG